jgi:hypothetical protein
MTLIHAEFPVNKLLVCGSRLSLFMLYDIMIQ